MDLNQKTLYHPGPKNIFTVLEKIELLFPEKKCGARNSMYQTFVLITIGIFLMIMLLVVMVMAAYLAARLSYVQAGGVACFVVNNASKQFLYANAVTAAVLTGISILFVLVMMGAGLSAVHKNRPQSGSEAPMTQTRDD